MREIRLQMAEKSQNADSGKEIKEKKNKQERKDNTTTEMITYDIE